MWLLHFRFTFGQTFGPHSIPCRSTANYNNFFWNLSLLFKHVPECVMPTLYHIYFIFLLYHNSGSCWLSKTNPTFLSSDHLLFVNGCDLVRELGLKCKCTCVCSHWISGWPVLYSNRCRSGVCPICKAQAVMWGMRSLSLLPSALLRTPELAGFKGVDAAQPIRPI